MTRDEMVEWLITQEPGNPRLQEYLNRTLYATDHRAEIDHLMALQEHLKGTE